MAKNATKTVTAVIESAAAAPVVIESAAPPVGSKVDKIERELLAFVPMLAKADKLAGDAAELRSGTGGAYSSAVQSAIHAGDHATWKAAAERIDNAMRSNANGLAKLLKLKVAKRGKAKGTTYVILGSWKSAKNIINGTFTESMPFTAADGKPLAYSAIRKAYNQRVAEKAAAALTGAALDRHTIAQRLASIGTICAAETLAESNLPGVIMALDKLLGELRAVTAKPKAKAADAVAKAA